MYIYIYISPNSLQSFTLLFDKMNLDLLRKTSHIYMKYVIFMQNESDVYQHMALQTRKSQICN